MINKEVATKFHDQRDILSPRAGTDVVFDPSRWLALDMVRLRVL
jgi:hypothetical protein